MQYKIIYQQSFESLEREVNKFIKENGQKDIKFGSLVISDGQEIVAQAVILKDKNETGAN